MLENIFSPIADAAGAPIDYIKLFTCLLLAFPLAALFPYIPSAPLKHLYSLSVSFVFLVPILNLYNGFLQLFGSALATYYICKLRIGGKNMAWLVFALQMSHLTYNHAVRKFGAIPLSTIEITAMQMVAVMNLSTFAWDCYDGQIRTFDQCDEAQKKSRITKMPDLLEFLGYAFYFPGVLIGPSTRFCDYRAWSTGQLFVSPKGKEKATTTTTAAAAAGTNSINYPRGRIAASLFSLCTGLGFMAIYTLYAPAFSYEKLIGLHGGLSHLAWYEKLVWIQIAGFMARTKYYGIWSLTDGACILSGLGYNGVNAVNGKTRWDRCKNVDIAKIEFANNWKELLDAWNMNTNVWLRNNVYKRIARPGKKPGFKSTMTTFCTSAFWHGLEPGYYLSFVLAGFMQSAAKMLRRHVRPLFFAQPNVANPMFTNLHTFSAAQLVYCTASILVSQLTLNYAVAPFMLLEFKASIAGWKAVYFYGHIVTFVAMIGFQNGLGKVLDKKSGKIRKSGKQEQSSFASGFTTDADSDAEAFKRRVTNANSYSSNSNGINGSNVDGEKEDEKITALAPEPIS
ncbi:related to ALE1 - broad-specificity lysophospholipid acyltransferase [Melanopsichium pennsylvanicum]|uniref:Related to ALE1 - broad-specificity lysophospholipid acyltransferase n=2 Tax=Melanopsichium pennsylvanicum TaxID=63383 RepID=A0AAJ4XI38_9BASI|nr:endoplasmic reticulum protein [Melanopsichium pennsylvanicum 4]SNX82789.1 related to ALE1 - broad-specificity lysophospholipid acyltransferase [Melanopsichium pennsylvanicum]